MDVIQRRKFEVSHLVLAKASRIKNFPASIPFDSRSFLSAALDVKEILQRNFPFCLLLVIALFSGQIGSDEKQPRSA
jgi:hypothetical protein